MYKTIISIILYGQTESTDADDTGSFLCAHDPYFTLISEPELETELLTVSEIEFEEALNDTIAENDGFVAPNYDYVTTLAPMKTVEDTNCDNFINARKFGSMVWKTPLMPVALIFHLVNILIPEGQMAFQTPFSSRTSEKANKRGI